MTVTTAAFDGVTSRDRPVISLGRFASQLACHLILASAAVGFVGIAVVSVALTAGWLTSAWSPTRHGDLPRAKFGLRQLALVPQYPAPSEGLGPADIVVFPPTVASNASAQTRVARQVDAPAPAISPPSPPLIKRAGATGPVPLPRAMPSEIARSRTAAAEMQVASAPPPIPPPAPEHRTAPQRADAPSPSLTTPDSRTAIYDIAAHIVYLPNGERLEAHSGLGRWRDDPRAVSVKNRGPTPPNIYALSLRESLFHGVRAIRLTPVDNGRMFGRDGMLAHTYMLGSGGDSNGCVSFKNYQAFLQAYLNGNVARLIVVPRHGAALAQTARARHGIRYAANEP